MGKINFFDLSAGEAYTASLESAERITLNTGKLQA